MSKIHIAFVRPNVKTIILSGDKTVESRLSVRKHPARLVQRNDTLLFKCGDGFALADVLDVNVYADMTRKTMQNMRERYIRAVSGQAPDLRYWDSKANSRHAVFIEFAVTRLVEVPAYLLPSPQLGWVQNYEPTDAVRDLLSLTRK